MTKTRNFIFKFSIPIPIASKTFKISTLDISSSINKIIQSKWKIREDPPTITKKKKRSQLIFVVIIEHDEVSADSWFADPSGKRWGWFVRSRALGGSTAKQHRVVAVEARFRCFRTARNRNRASPRKWTSACRRRARHQSSDSRSCRIRSRNSSSAEETRIFSSKQYF